MKAIGGYFEWELAKGDQSFHNTLALKSGRAALLYILMQVSPKKIYIPFYTCDALLEPIIKTNTPFQFYSINKAMEPESLPVLEPDEYFLYINYFDLKRTTVERLSKRYKGQLIIDGSQAFFLNHNGKSWLFNSCRKFFGVPDGAFVYAPEGVELEPITDRNKQYTVQHLDHRLNGEVKEGYPFYLQNEGLCGADLKQMSHITERLLSLVDYAKIMQKRKENFSTLHKALQHLNLFEVSIEEGCPMAYPFLPSRKIDHQKLWELEIYIPVLWKDVINRESNNHVLEKSLAAHLLPVPIDQRYSSDDMTYLIEQLYKL